jgi:hypothetical protein
LERDLIRSKLNYIHSFGYECRDIFCVTNRHSILLAVAKYRFSYTTLQAMSSKSTTTEKQDLRICQFIRTQRSVKQWIEEVLNIKDKLDEDLFKSLQSGVILCYLMLEIEERSIPRIQESILR